METETTIGKRREPYNLRSGVVLITLPEDRRRVSKAQEEETAKGNKPGDDQVARICNPRCGPGPPPMSGEDLKNHLMEMQRRSRDYASKAMYWYNKGRRQLGLPVYKIVEILGLEGRDLSCGTVWHLNFKARPKGDPAAPLELFFGERVITWHGSKVTRCYNMGTESPEPDTVGRKACTHCFETYHPRGIEFAGSLDHLL